MKSYKVKLTEREIDLLKKYGYDYMTVANNTVVSKKTYVMINKVLDSISHKEVFGEQITSL